MKDFLLNVNGDIVFQKSTLSKDSFQLDFLISPYKAIAINFYIENYNNFKHIDNLTPQFLFNFNIKKIENDKKVIMAEDEEEYLKQQIKIRLETPLNTLLCNEEIGSNISIYNHKVMGNDFEEIKECVKEAISDILPNAKIQVQKIDTIYLDYSNSLMITINFKNYNYYYYV